MRARERELAQLCVGEDVIVVRTVGIDLGVTSASRLAVADDTTISWNRRVSSAPEALTRAIRDTANGERINLVVESTAMAWLVAAVAAERSGVPHTLYRISGTKAAALRAFYRQHTKTDRIDAPVLARMPYIDDALHEFHLPTAEELALKRLVTLRHRIVQDMTRLKGRIRSMLHWAAPKALTSASLGDGIVRVLRRWPDLRTLATARPATIALEGGLTIERACAMRQRVREAVAFYGDRVDFESLGCEFEVVTAQLGSLQKHLARLDDRISRAHAAAFPDDPLRSLPGVGPAVASIVRATVGDARAFKNAAAMRSYTGLVPKEASSGDAQRRGRVSKAGPRLLRWALYMAADIARKHDPHLAHLYHRLMVHRGKHHNQALCAVATHLSDRMFAIMREGRTYELRNLDGEPITPAEAKIISAQLAVDTATRQRLRATRRELRSPGSRQPTAPHDEPQPSTASLANQALDHARSA